MGRDATLEAVTVVFAELGQWQLLGKTADLAHSVPSVTQASPIRACTDERDMSLGRTGN